MTITEMIQPDDYSGGRIERVDLDTGAVTVLYTECDGHPLMGPNDIVFDATGGMWFTDHGKVRERERDHGGVYYAAPDGSSITEVIYPLESPNGIGLSPEGDRLYVAETHTGRVYWWPVESPGVVGKPNPVGHGGLLLAGLPGMQLLDSLGVDSAGNVVVGTLVNGGLTVIPPEGDAGRAHPAARPHGHERLLRRRRPLHRVRHRFGHRQAVVAAVAPPGPRARVLSLTYTSGTA